jgi:hypothetical protein
MVDGLAYTLSFDAKPDGYNFVSTFMTGFTGTVVWDLATQTPPSGGTITPLDGGWFRCSVTNNATITGNVSARLYCHETSNPFFAGDGVKGALCTRASVTQGDSPYQRIGTNPGTSVLFPATLSPGKSAAGDDLQFAGPVPMNGQAEESNALTFDGVDDFVQFTPADMNAIAAADQVVNGTFAADSDWTKGTGWTISGGTANKSAGTASNLDQAQTLTVGRSYLITYTMTRTAGTLNVALSGGTTVNGANRTASGTYTEVLVAVTGNNNLRFAADSSFAGTLDNVIVKELPVITKQGTSTVTYRSQGDGITGTAGTAYEIKLGTAEEIPCSEGADDKVHGVIRNTAYRVVNSQPAMWFNKQNIFHYNMVHGHSLGVFDPVAEINELLFSTGNQGTFIAPTWSETMIGGNSFGTGVQNILDLSPRNNPFSQATPSSRGAWFREPKTGARQLLANSGFLGAVSGSPGTGPTNWTRSLTATATQTFDPVLKSLRITGVSQRLNYLQQIPVLANTTYIFSVKANVFSASSWNQNFLIQSAPSGSTLTFQQDDGEVTTNANSVLSTQNNSILKAILVVGSTAGTIDARFGVGISSNSISDIEFYEPQFEIGSTRSTYQLSGLTLFDVTEQGQRDCFGVRADGTDDFYTTAGNVDFSGTDKVTVFAAVRKLSDAGFGIITELTANADTTVGGFNVVSSTTRADASRRTYGAFAWAVRGRGVGLFTAPSTNIVTALYDMSTASTATDIRVRVDGTEITGEVSGDNLSGNFANSILYLFRRGGTTVPFNGNLYALIVAGGSYPLSTIQRVEHLLSTITPRVDL